MSISVGNPDFFAKARFWSEAEGNTVRCELCPHGCRIVEGKFGVCRHRRNVGGKMTLPYFGRFGSLAIDPIEKKPLYHFYPKTPILSIGSVGCNLSCRFCQNWQISQPETVPPLDALPPGELAQLAVKKNIPLVAFTYNEPSISAEYVIAASEACHRSGQKTVAVTNGMISGKAREDFYKNIDGANIDLKAFTPEFYHDLCGGDFCAVKETIAYVAQKTDVWLELTTLLIPGRNDSDEELRALADWVAATCGCDTPLHFSAFFPTYRLTDLPRTPPETLRRAEKIARAAGLRYVYCGNIADTERQTTRCPNCGEPLIVRDGYRTDNRLAANGQCPACETKIAGRFLKG